MKIFLVFKMSLFACLLLYSFFVKAQNQSSEQESSKKDAHHNELDPRQFKQKKDKRGLPSFFTVYHNNKALSKLEVLLKEKQNKPKEPLDYELLAQAETHMYKALKNDSENPVLHFNLGLFLTLKGEPLKAIKEWSFSFKNWLESEVLEKFMTLFNKGLLKGVLGKKKEALEFYQESLELNPESLEVRTNIELLFLEQNQGGGGGGGEGDPQEDSQGEGGATRLSELNEKQIEELLKEIEQQDRKTKEKNMKTKQRGSPHGKNW